MFLVYNYPLKMERLGSSQELSFPGQGQCLEAQPELH